MPKGITAHGYDLTDLRVFLAVVDEGSVSRGAQRSYLAPSSVSERVHALEATLGVTLLERRARGVSATRAGRILAEHARRCLAQLEQMHSELAPYASGLRGQVTLFANTTALTAILPTALESFFAANPRVNINLRESTSLNTLAAVAEGRADIGIVGERHHPELAFHPLCEDRLVLLLPAAHALASHESVSFIDCLNEPFVSLHNGAAMHSFILERATELGARLDIRVQVNDYFTAKKLVGSGAGVAVVPKSVTEPLGERLTFVPLNDAWAIRQLRICTQLEPGSENPNVGLLVEHLLGH